MKTIVVNGSPKGKKGNTEIFIENFISGMKKDILVKRIIEEDYEDLANLTKEYDSVIIALPLYVHGMPGIVMRFIEHLEVNPRNEKRQIGFILQYGFPESFQGEYIERYFKALAEELNMRYLGTFVKPDSAGVYAMPKIMTKKLFVNLKRFGRIYEEDNKFDETIMKKMKSPYKITGWKIKAIDILKKIGLTDIIWNKILKDNNAFDKRYDQPYI